MALLVAALIAAATPGVTSNSIVIGGTAATPSTTARGAGAYFSYINARGGVLGRKVVYRYLDDDGDPARTLSAVRQLVEQEGVFALFNTPGTSNNLAIRGYLNGRKVPQLFVASGYAGWGPYTIGFPPTHRAEGMVYGRYLASTRPGARIAVLYEDDEDGRDLLAGLRRGLGGTSGTVAFRPTEPSVDSQVAALRQTKATVLMLFCSGKVAPQAVLAASRLGWRPEIFVGSGAAGTASRGAISAGFAKEPADPAWTKDPGIKLFRKVMGERGLGSPANLRNGAYVLGMASAFTLVDTLRNAGQNLTRAAVVKAAGSLNEADNPFLLPGIVVRTGPRDRIPIEQMQLQRWNGTRWVRFGGLVTAKT